MGLFDKLLGKSRQAADKTTPATGAPKTSGDDGASGSYRNDSATGWIREFATIWTECCVSLQSIKGSDATTVRATIIPCLTDNIETAKKIYTGILAGGFQFVHLGGAVVGVTWCQACQHPTFLISEPRPGQTQACSACGRELPVSFFVASARVMEQIRDIFERHSVCLDRRDRAAALEQRGKTEDALVLYRQAEAICRDLDTKPVLAAVLNDIASLLNDRGDAAQAVALCEEALGLRQAGGDRPGMADVLHNYASAWIDLRRPELAKVYLDQAEDICREDPSDLARLLRLAAVLFGKAAIAADSVATLSSASPLLDEVAQVNQRARKEFRAKTGQDLPVAPSDQMRQVVDRKRATLGEGIDAKARSIEEAIERKDKAQALTMTQEVIATLRQLGDLPLLRTWLNGSLPLFLENGKIVEALQACQQIEEIARLNQDKPALHAALSNQAQILTLLEQAAPAQVKASEGKVIDKELKALREGLPARKDALASALRAKDWNTAARLAAQQEEALRILGNDQELIEATQHLIEAERGRENCQAAIRGSERLEALGNKLSNPAVTTMGLDSQGEILLQLDRWRDAIARLTRAAGSFDEAIANEVAAKMDEVIAILPQLLDQRRRRIATIRFIGDSAADKGDLEGAADAYRATAAVCERLLGHPPEDFELRFAHLAVVDELGITLMKGDTKQREEGREAVRRAHQMLNDLDSKDPGNRESRRSVRKEIEGHLNMR